jgi:hypothetical protein
MADGPPQNLPQGLDAYAGYVNKSGIGITFPQVVAMHPKAHHLSITTDGSPAMCADVETGAMDNWVGYDYGYCSVSNVNILVHRFGRPRKLWTAHRDPNIGKHLCSPQCWPGLVTMADATQWSNHNGAWDESACLPTFFDPPPIPLPTEEEIMAVMALPGANTPNRVLITAVGAGSRANQLLVFTINDPTNGVEPGYSVLDVTDGIGGPDPYTVSSA